MEISPTIMNHTSDRACEIALNNTILRARVGSELFGVSTGDGDRDEMGICIEPPSCVIGLEEFEQYQFRTQPDGVRSGPGDLDLTIYSLRKWARLTAQGNPTVLLLLFVPDEYLANPFSSVTRNYWTGCQLQRRKDLFISKDCGRRFLGYLQSQKDAMLGLRAKKTNRPELVDVYGYDTKFAYHAIRLGLQGIELLETGHITLPMSDPHRSTLIELRKGAYSRQYALDWIDDLQDRLAVLTETVDLPEHADMIKLNRWLMDTYTDWWKG